MDEEGLGKFNQKNFLYPQKGTIGMAQNQLTKRIGYYVKKHLLWNTPLIAFILYIPFSEQIDLNVSASFLGPEGKFQASTWCWKIYRYGLRPGQLLFVTSIITTCIALLLRKRKTFLHALYVSLVLIIGSGIIGHGIFKRFWQRPRPKQTILFGSKYPFCAIYKRYTGPVDRHLRSVPSGHATMGFYFISLFFLGRRLNKKFLAITGIALTLILTFLLSWARLAQGGHFLSDLLAACVIMWTTAYWLDILFDKLERPT